MVRRLKLSEIQARQAKAARKRKKLREQKGAQSEATQRIAAAQRAGTPHLAFDSKLTVSLIKLGKKLRRLSPDFQRKEAKQFPVLNLALQLVGLEKQTGKWFQAINSFSAGHKLTHEEINLQQRNLFDIVAEEEGREIQRKRFAKEEKQRIAAEKEIIDSFTSKEEEVYFGLSDSEKRIFLALEPHHRRLISFSCPAVIERFFARGPNQRKVFLVQLKAEMAGDSRELTLRDRRLNEEKVQEREKRRNLYGAFGEKAVALVKKFGLRDADGSIEYTERINLLKDYFSIPFESANHLVFLGTHGTKKSFADYLESVFKEIPLNELNRIDKEIDSVLSQSNPIEFMLKNKKRH
ncbi:MAG: hypothetical protein ABIA76_00315 [Candidatus Diapherotrites archaeon]